MPVCITSTRLMYPLGHLRKRRLSREPGRSYSHGIRGGRCARDHLVHRDILAQLMEVPGLDVSPFWDNGTLLANILAVSTASGLPAEIVLGFVDAEVNRLLD